MALLHMSVTVRDIETKLFKDSDDRTVLRPENMENVMFHMVIACSIPNGIPRSLHEKLHMFWPTWNFMEYKTGTSILQDRRNLLLIQYQRTIANACKVFIIIGPTRIIVIDTNRRREGQ